jgi:outer membrane protein assembly factor BamE (lipoprotein component of BamABCDE complex)
MKLNISRTATSTVLAACILLSGASAFAASGFTMAPTQEAQITVGMSRDEVRGMLGRPAHNMKYMNEPGRTWTYGVVGKNVVENTVFDVDFGSDGKVMQSNERLEVISK